MVDSVIPAITTVDLTRRFDTLTARCCALLLAHAPAAANLPLDCGVLAVILAALVGLAAKLYPGLARGPTDPFLSAHHGLKLIDWRSELSSSSGTLTPTVAL